MSFKIALQRNGVIVRRVVGAEQQGNDAFARSAANPLQSLGFRIQFRKIAALKRLPFRRIVAKPLSQCRTGRGIFHPGVKMQGFLADATRPEPLNEKTYPSFDGSARS